MARNRASPTYQKTTIFPEFKGGVLPKITASKQQKTQIIENVKAACDEQGRTFGTELTFEEILNGPEGSVRAAEEAIRWLVCRKRFSVDIPKFRKMIGPSSPLRKSIEKLRDVLPVDDFAPPWFQLREAFTGKEIGDDDGEIERYQKKFHEWQERYHPVVFRQSLDTYLKLLDDLQSGSKGTRPLEVPERAFVEELASYWRYKLKLETKNGRGGEMGQQGHFANFVRGTLKLYPSGCPKLGSLDGHIRIVAGAQTSPKPSKIQPKTTGD